jgi:hypothetical protein
VSADEPSGPPATPRELTPEEAHFVIHHLQRGNPPAMRREAMARAAARLAVTSDAELTLALIRLAEDPAEEDADLQALAVRALARATGGQPLRLDL